MKAKILLINPPTSRNQFIGSDDYFPVGLLSLATVLKVNNIDVKVIDINNHFYGKDLNIEVLNDYINNNLYNYIKDHRPDLIGLGCLFSGAFNNLLIVADKIKNKFPDTTIVIGGMHPTVFAREILSNYTSIDYVIIGEGEVSFLALIDSLINNNRSFKIIDGIAFRDKGCIKLNPKTDFINNVDKIPFADYSILNIEDYTKLNTSNWYSPKGIKIGQPFPIISSRSCPNRCNFCSMWLVHGPKIRLRSPDNVLNEIEQLYKIYNVRYFQFMDDNMTFDKKRTLEICTGILERNMNIQFDTLNGVAINRLDGELIDAMVDAGWVSASIAIESGSEYIRNKVMGKGLSNKKIYEVVEGLAKHKHLFIKGFFIIGMPEETHETLQETYKMIEDLPLDKFGVYFATPFPGTKLFNYCSKHNLLPNKAESYVNVEAFQPAADYPHFRPHKLSIEDLLSFKKKCLDYLQDKRMKSNLPHNFPLRYRG